jgi:hypothetical protein
MDLTEIGFGKRTGFILGQGPVVGSCEHDNELAEQLLASQGLLLH